MDLTELVSKLRGTQTAEAPDKRTQFKALAARGAVHKATEDESGRGAATDAFVNVPGSIRKLILNFQKAGKLEQMPATAAPASPASPSAPASEPEAATEEDPEEIVKLMNAGMITIGEAQRKLNLPVDPATAGWYMHDGVPVSPEVFLRLYETQFGRGVDTFTNALNAPASTDVAAQTNAVAKLKAAVDSWKKYRDGIKAAPQPLSTGFKIVTGEDGVSRWWGVYSGTYYDRDKEAFAKEAIDAFIERVDSGAAPFPELRVWHLGNRKKGLRIGRADLIARVGNFVMAAGTFDDTKHAQKARAYYAEHLDETAFSHGFTHFTDDRKDGVYTAFDTFEISTLDRGYESFPYTKLVGVKAMDINATKRRRLEAIFGKEDLDALLAEIEETDKELARRGVLHKALEDDGIAELVAALERLNMTPAQFAAMLNEVLDTQQETPDEAPAPEDDTPPPATEPPPDEEDETEKGYSTDAFWRLPVRGKETTSAKAGIVRDPFWRHEVKQKAATQRLTIGKKSFWLNGSKQFDVLEQLDAIYAMRDTLELAPVFVDMLVQRHGQQGTFDLLKAVIEAGGGKVAFSVEVVGV